MKKEEIRKILEKTYSVIFWVKLAIMVLQIILILPDSSTSAGAVSTLQTAAIEIFIVNLIGLALLYLCIKWAKSGHIVAGILGIIIGIINIIDTSWLSIIAGIALIVVSILFLIYREK